MRLRPRNNNADLLAALSALADRLVAGCDLVGRIVTADFASRAQLRDELHAVEHEADEIHHRFLHLLSHTFVTAIDRDDLRRIAGLLDDCLDAVDQAGDAIVLYQAGALPQACTEQV
ncbi:MAG: Phosphate transport regulator, partial [Actinomyces urogenitalis DORA_12]